MARPRPTTASTSGSASGRIDREDALTAEEAERGVEAGRALADEEIDSGADLLVPASIGVGATTPASTIVAALTGTEPVAVIGRGSGIDDAGWMRKAAAVRDALRRAKPGAHEPLTLLRVAGGADLAVLTGFCLQAAVRRTPVLLDGLVVGAAAMLADVLAPGARQWWLAAQRSPEPAMAIVLDRLELTPLVDLGVRLGDGTGAAAVVPLVQMSARLLGETARADLASRERCLVRGWRSRCPGSRCCRCARAAPTRGRRPRRCGGRRWSVGWSGRRRAPCWSGSSSWGCPRPWRGCSRWGSPGSRPGGCTSTAWPTPPTAWAVTARPSGPSR